MSNSVSSFDSLAIGTVVKIVKLGHPMHGRVGRIAAGLDHPSAIKLKPGQYWVVLISNKGENFYGRYERDELSLKLSGGI